MMLLGDKIKQLRKNQKITQDELADKIYVSRQTISNWENNKSYPSMDFIFSISEVFNVPIDILIKEDLEISKNERNEEIKHMKRNSLKQEQNTIQKNKYRVVLNNLLRMRLIFLWIGILFTSYFYFSKTYLDYIWIPISLIIFSLSTTIPIEMIKKKYQLKDKYDLISFLDALYK